MRGFFAFGVMGVAAISLSGSAQSFDTTVGSSQIYGSSGIVTEYRRGDAYGWAGIGYSDGLRYGSFYSAPLRVSLAGGPPARLEIGDQSLSAFLDVDEYDSHSFTVRGAGLVHKTDLTRLQIFAGALTEETIQPYTHFATINGGALQQTPLGALIYQRKFSPTLQFHSLNLFTDKLTSIQSIGWKTSRTWRFAGAAGLGFGTPYLSIASEYRKRIMDLRTSYTFAGHAFHRQEGPYASNEPLGLNARLQLAPGNAIRFGIAHEHTLTFMAGQFEANQPMQPGSTVVSTFDSANAFASFLGIRVSASASTGKEDNAVGNTTTELLTASRKLMSRWTSFGSIVKMKMPLGKNTALININEFRLNSRLALRQNFTRMDGQNSFSMGGEWKSNILSFSVEQQTLISPLAATLGQSGMLQAWTFSVRLRTPHGTTANIDTFADPMGHMQWGGYMNGLRYDPVGPKANSNPTFSKYVVEGFVVDQNGNGVWGIAISIGGEMVFSDDHGGFFLHVKNAKPLPLSVEVGSSLQSAHWVLESAPTTVCGSLEDAPATPLRLVVNLRGRKSGN